MTIKWTEWEPDTGSRTSMLFVDGVQKDSTYTATFKVNDRDWEHDVTVDVIDKKEVSTSTLSGTNTIMSCGYDGAQVAPKASWWTSSKFTGKLDATNKVTGYTYTVDTKARSDGFLYQVYITIRNGPNMEILVPDWLITSHVT